MKKIVLLNTFQQSGGAAIAATRLLNALKHTAYQTNLVVSEVTKEAIGVNGLNPKNAFGAKWQRFKMLVEFGITEKFIKKANQSTTFSAAFWGMHPHKNAIVQAADLLHLHWVNHGFCSIQDLNDLFKLRKPIIWHLHDMWPFTGGCHYAGDCLGYQKNCGNCNMLRSKAENDLSNKIHIQKDSIYRNANITWVGASKWIAEQAKKSSLTKNHRILHIPNPIATKLFKPTNKTAAKAALNIGSHKQVFLFASANTSDPRKGFNFLQEALQKSKNLGLLSDAVVLLIGKSNRSFHDFPVQVIETGYVNSEEALVQAYNAADVFVIPSLEDNLPNTLVEAMSCGVPAVGFETGGIPELILHEQTGYLAPIADTDALLHAMCFAFNNSQLLGQQARQFIENNLSELHVAKAYGKLYAEILGE